MNMGDFTETQLPHVHDMRVSFWGRSSITTKTEPDQVGDDLQQNRQGRGKNDLFYYFDVSMWRRKVSVSQSVMEENLPMLRLKEKRK